MPLLSSIKERVLGAKTEKPAPIVEAPTVKYKEFVPQELPEEYRKFTPEWLYSRIDWRLQAQELRAQDMSNTREKLKIGLTIAVIIVGCILVLCLVAIAMGGQNA